MSSRLHTMRQTHAFCLDVKRSIIQMIGHNDMYNSWMPELGLLCSSRVRTFQVKGITEKKGPPSPRPTSDNALDQGPKP